MFITNLIPWTLNSFISLFGYQTSMVILGFLYLNLKILAKIHFYGLKIAVIALFIYGLMSLLVPMIELGQTQDLQQAFQCSLPHTTICLFGVSAIYILLYFNNWAPEYRPYRFDKIFRRFMDRRLIQWGKQRNLSIYTCVLENWNKPAELQILMTSYVQIRKIKYYKFSNRFEINYRYFCCCLMIVFLILAFTGLGVIMHRCCAFCFAFEIDTLLLLGLITFEMMMRTFSLAFILEFVAM